MGVQQFITLWSASGASERANKDSYLKDLADVLGVPHPAPCTGDGALDSYVLEADAEERRNLVRWLRPEFQQPGASAARTLSLGLNVVTPEEIDVASAKGPAILSDCITAVREPLSRTDEAIGVEQVSRRFKGAPRSDDEAILESLSAVGIAVALDAGKGRRWMRARAAA